MQSAPKLERETAAPEGAVILPFPLRASRHVPGEKSDASAPRIALVPANDAAPVSSPELTVATSAAPLPPRYRDWLQIALIASVLFHLAAFTVMNISFRNDLERAANAGGAVSSDGTVTLEVDIVAEATLPPAKAETNMTSPEAKAEPVPTPEMTPEQPEKTVEAPPEPAPEPKPEAVAEPIPEPAPPAPTQAPQFALPEEPAAVPQKAETAPAPQAPTPERVETPTPPEMTVVQEPQKPEPPKPVVEQLKQKIAQPKKQQKKKSAPTAAASPARPAAARNPQGQAGNRGNAQTGGQADVSSYNARVLAHLQRYRNYPAAARSQGVTGVAMIRFTLSASGAVVSASLSRSSGAGMLDQAALAMVRSASPFPPFPPGLGRNSMSFAAPIRFNLR